MDNMQLRDFDLSDSESDMLLGDRSSTVQFNQNSRKLGSIVLRSICRLVTLIIYYIYVFQLI